MTCTVTGDVFKDADNKSKHTRCSKCGHCKQCDHHKQTESRHVHYQDYQNIHARTFKTTYHGVVCEVALCYCVTPDPFKSLCKV